MLHPAILERYPWIFPNDPDFAEESLRLEVLDLTRDMTAMAQRLVDLSEKLLPAGDLASEE